MLSIDVQDLTTVHADLALSRTAFASFTAPALEHVGSLQVANNDDLTAVTLALTGANGTVRVTWNPLLDQLDLGTPSQLDSVIVQSTALTTLEVQSLTELGGLQLNDNPVLQTVDLGNVTLLGSSPVCEDTYYPSLGSISVSDNPLLETLDVRGIPEVMGLYLIDLPALASLRLDGLGVVYQGVTLERTGLADLEGLGSLAVVSDSLRIRELGALQDLGGLSAATWVGSLDLRDNALLADLSPLVGVYVDGALTIRDNAALSQCEADAFAISISSCNIDHPVDVCWENDDTYGYGGGTGCDPMHPVQVSIGNNGPC